ncbi:MAG: hypothetical protein WCA35_25325, partial [Kovacikia sp.]
GKNSKFGVNSSPNWDVSSLQPEAVNEVDELPLQERFSTIQPDLLTAYSMPENLTENGQELVSVHYEVEEGTGVEYRYGRSYYTE